MRNQFAFALLCLLSVLGMTFSSHAISDPPAIGMLSSSREASTPPAMGSNPISATNWSFECVFDSSCGPDPTGGGTWISTTSQPGTVRLYDDGTAWSILNTAPNTYEWTNLDTWLDMIAQHQPRAVIFTFSHIPCFIASTPCSGGGGGSSGKYYTASVPSDLNANGSKTFTSFVTQLVQHCSPAGNCVKDYIKYWEMWDEPNDPHYWVGTVNQLYDMFKPVVPIIRSYVPNAIVSTPPVDGGDTAWITSWITLENTQARLSDYFGFHTYLSTYEPEQRMNMIKKMVAAKNAAGWTTAPWWNTETNFQIGEDTCSTQFTIDDCRGQLVRWHVLQYAYQGGAGGAYHVGWYDFPSIASGGYDTYYYTMMQWLTGSTFTASCTYSGTVYTCPLTEANGASALIVWDSAASAKYTPATEYKNYKSFNGTYGGKETSITPGEATEIGLIPIMFATK
jgi:polysaccharide biosynthesis protein PslG